VKSGGGWLVWGDPLLTARSSEIRPTRAPISPGFSHTLEEKPVKFSISVRVENTPNFRPVYQNTVGLHLT
jgi:hypothetical protein